MRRLNLIAATSAVVAAFCSASPVMAQVSSVSGQVQSKLVLTSGCVVQTGDDDPVVGDFGVLDFGSYPGTFEGPLTATVQGAGNGNNAEIICTQDYESLKLTIDGGTHAGSLASAQYGTGTRVLASGTDYIKYEVYQDAGHTEAYLVDTETTVEFDAASSTFDVPIYGKIEKSGNAAWPSGTYTDTLNVKIAW